VPRERSECFGYARGNSYRIRFLDRGKIEAGTLFLFLTFFTCPKSWVIHLAAIKSYLDVDGLGIFS